MPERPDKTKVVIGWREWVSLPEIGVTAIKAKIDTGARSSSIHAFDVETYFRGAVEIVRFTLHPLQLRDHPQILAELPILERRVVRSSNGVTDNRIVVRTQLLLREVQIPIELTLANRDAMGFRMLVGREALRGRFLVDSEKSFLSGRATTSRGPARSSGDKRPPQSKLSKDS
jgi:hypothetical protein